MKKFVIFILLACYAAGVQAQSMSDSQVMEFILKEHKRGTSQATIVTKLMQRGVNITQIRRVRDNYLKIAEKHGFVILDASRPKEELCGKAMEHIEELLR